MKDVRNLETMLDLYLKNEKQPLNISCQFKATGDWIEIKNNVNEQLKWNRLIKSDQIREWLLELDRYHYGVKLLNYYTKKAKVGWKAKVVDEQGSDGLSQILITFYQIANPEHNWALLIEQQWFGYLDWDEQNRAKLHHFLDWIKCAISPLATWLDPDLISYY